ncbi:BON domain-containing protein [Candidatus Finniella inopinata]|uniref:BON domain-containing protein n=1 Tax=Candidatus Finniella inopinata TaxID=1696036 RepID=A0A4Q7DHD7_9PROT|nr:BON domain-containing protein [Candidatus Finniella inopinata]RZI45445.1 BON domain-containing protein [Candidatus Finniella inopinata]
MSDTILKNQISEKFNVQPGLRPQDINISVENGIVTLSGRVRSYFEKSLAERAVKSIDGVKAVIEELQVELDASLQRSDADIAAAAIRALEWDMSLPVNKIQVTVEKGVIKLTGEVEYQYQKENAYSDVRYLYGVRNVLNAIVLKPSVLLIDPERVSKQIISEFQRNAVLDAKHIAVETEGTKIILKGKVRSWAELEEAKKAAWAVPGVTDVEAQLTISYAG